MASGAHNDNADHLDVVLVAASNVSLLIRLLFDAQFEWTSPFRSQKCLSCISIARASLTNSTARYRLS